MDWSDEEDCMLFNCLKLCTQVLAPCCGLEAHTHSNISGRAGGLCLCPAHLILPQLPPHHRLYPRGERNQRRRRETDCCLQAFKELEQQILPSPAPASEFPCCAGPVCVGMYVSVTSPICSLCAGADGHVETVCGRIMQLDGVDECHVLLR